ncbi:MAG: hypothetical protein AAFV88_00525 [Planctomycetota bacterium]
MTGLGNDPSEDTATPSEDKPAAASEPIATETVAGKPQTPNDPAPIVAKLVSPDGGNEESQPITGVRVGSPFRVDPQTANAESKLPEKPATPEASYAEFGPYVYTAMGASVAAILVVGFASAGAIWFPAGGTLVSILGGFLSMLGLFSTGRFRWLAMAGVVAHGGLFFLSYTRWLS